MTRVGDWVCHCVDGQEFWFRQPLAEAPKLDENWMRVAPGTDAAIWRPWSRETGEL